MRTEEYPDEIKDIKSELSQARKERNEAQAAAAVMIKTLKESGWHTCGCPGHWREHAVNCPIGSVLSFHDCGTAFLARMEEAEWLLENYHDWGNPSWLCRRDAFLKGEG